jgi:chromosome segregation ATPase
MKGGRIYIKHYYLHLARSKKAHVCNQHPKYISQTKAEQLVRALYTDCFTNDKEIKKFIDIQAKEVQNERKALDSRIGTIEKRLVELEKQRQRLIGLVQTGDVSASDISIPIGKLNKEKADLEKSLDEASKDILLKEATIEDLIEQFRGTDSWNMYDLNDIQRRELYMRRMKSCTMKGYVLTVEWITGKVNAVDTSNIPEALQARMRTIDNLVKGKR